MKNYKTMTKTQLTAEYYNQFGVCMAHENPVILTAALMYGKPVSCLTQEEIDSIGGEI